MIIFQAINIIKANITIPAIIPRTIYKIGIGAAAASVTQAKVRKK